MAALEKSAFERGANPAAAAESVARGMSQYIVREKWKQVTILVGKGNNGGDGARLGSLLLEGGVEAELLYLEGEGSSLRERYLSDFKGKRAPLREAEIRFEPDRLIVDALFGTGFKGPLDPFCSRLIENVNKRGRRIYSVDIPSGLDGESGEPSPVAIRAHTTFYCGLAKTGFFLRSGFAYVGQLIPLPLGIDLKKKSAWRLMEREDLQSLLPPIDRLRNKFEAGSVSGVVASNTMAGAGILSSMAAFRAGSGYVRLAFSCEGEAAVGAAPLEVVKYLCEDPREVVRVLNMSKAAWVGPGLPETDIGEPLVRACLEGLAVPSVIDGGALFHLSRMPDVKLPANAVLTPHRGEMHRLRALQGNNCKDDIEVCQRFAEERDVTLVLKGAPTWIFHPGEAVLVSPFGDPGMATAGSGDVLVGIIAAHLSAGLGPRQAAALGCALHGISGMLAAQELSSYSLIARDLIDYLPFAIKLIAAAP